MEEVLCYADLPYPQVEVAAPNKQYLSMIRDLYAGELSEMTFCAQFSYQQILQEGRCEEAEHVFGQIAASDMKHLKLLGLIIRELGGDPRFRCFKSARGMNYWSGSYLSYSMTVKKMLLDDIQSKKTGIAAYQKTLDVICDEGISAVLKRILMDEQIHLAVLCDLYERSVGAK